MSMSKKLLFAVSIMIVSIGATYADNKALPTSQTAIENHTKNEVQRKARVGAFARLKMASSRFANKVVDTASQCFYKVYRTANGTVYIVGLTTIGLVVYCYINGKLINNEAQAVYEITGVPVFNKITIDWPKNFIILKEKLDRAGQLAIQAKDYLKEQAQGFAEVVSKCPDGGTKQVAEVAAEELQKVAEVAAQIVEAVQ